MCNWCDDICNAMTTETGDSNEKCSVELLSRLRPSGCASIMAGGNWNADHQVQDYWQCACWI